MRKILILFNAIALLSLHCVNLQAQTDVTINSEFVNKVKQYDCVEGFDKRVGLAKVEKNKKYGYIDTNGNEVIPCVYSYVSDFHDGRAAVAKDYGVYGFVDTNGNEVIPCVIPWPVSSFPGEYETQFHDGVSFIRLPPNKPYRKGGSEYMSSRTTYGGVDNNGKMKFIYEFEDYRPFSEGRAIVRKADINGWGAIDTNGNKVVELKWWHLNDFHDGLACAKDNLDSKWVFIDKYGNIKFYSPNDFPTNFSEGLSFIERNSKWGYIDTNNRVVISPIYEKVSEFKNGLACVKKNGKYGYINKQGDIIIPFIYDSAESFWSDMAKVEQNGKFGVINKMGELVIPCMYSKDESGWCNSNGLISVCKNGKWGFRNKQGDIVIPCIYDGVGSFSHGVARVRIKKGDKEMFGYVDVQGNDTFSDPKTTNLKANGLSSDEAVDNSYKVPNSLSWWLSDGNWKIFLSMEEKDFLESIENLKQAPIWTSSSIDDIDKLMNTLKEEWYKAKRK